MVGSMAQMLSPILMFCQLVDAGNKPWKDKKDKSVLTSFSSTRILVVDPVVNWRLHPFGHAAILLW